MGRLLPLQGCTLRQVSGGVDQDLYRYPLVVTGIPPFNFPVMIPLWMMPLAVVVGNTFVFSRRSGRRWVRSDWPNSSRKQDSPVC